MRWYPVVLGRLLLVDLFGVGWGRNVCGDGYREEVWRCIRNGWESLDAGWYKRLCTMNLFNSESLCRIWFNSGSVGLRALGAHSIHDAGFPAQAILNGIPVIVGDFIVLFKDTMLIYVIWMLDVLKIGRACIQGNAEYWYYNDGFRVAAPA